MSRLDDEIQAHLDELTAKHLARGLSLADARLAARRDFGRETAVREAHREQGRWRWCDDMTCDVRHVTRSLLRTPAFTAAATLTLALAIAATTTIVTVVNGVLLQPLPYHASDRLVQLEHAIPRIKVSSGVGMTLGLFQQYVRRARTLDGVALYRTAQANFGEGDMTERLVVGQATTSLASVLGVSPSVGRWFTADEGRPGSGSVAVLTHALWSRRFGADQGVIGRKIELDGQTIEVVGVLPRSFAFPDPRVQLWVPDQIASTTGFGLPFDRLGVARLRPGATIQSARVDIDALIDDLPNAYPGDAGVLGNVGAGGLRSAVIPLKDAVIGNVGRPLWLLCAGVAVLLLVAYANVANLFLVRAETRQREMAVRRALGASGASLARLCITESAIVSMASSVMAIALASGGVWLVVSRGPATLPRLGEIRLDGVAIVSALVLGIIAALLCGTVPLWHRTPIAGSIREGSRANTVSAGRTRLRHVLMAGQVAMTLILLIAAGLIARSFQALRVFDPGFDAESTTTFEIGLPERSYPIRDAVVAAHQTILDRLAVVPGVTAVSASTGLPLANRCFANTVVVRGRRVLSVNTARPVVQFCAVAGGYLEAMRLRLLRGRGVQRSDVERREGNVMVNEAFAALLFPDRDVLEERFRSNAPPTSTPRMDVDGELVWEGAPPWLRAVGVVANTPFARLGENTPTPIVYLPMSIAGGPDVPALAMRGPDVSTMSYVVRSAIPTAGLLALIRRAVLLVDSTLAIAQVQTLENLLDKGSAQTAFTLTLLSIAAAATMFIGLIGVYGVIGYIVTQRTSEIGVRLALGAEPQRVAALILRQGGTVIFYGVIVGLALAWSFARLMASLLYGVGAHDPIVFLLMPLMLCAVALLACWIPARRATRVDPLVALRSE